MAFDAQGTVIEQRGRATLFAGALIVSAAAGVMWAHVMGDIIFKASVVAALALTVATIFWDPLIGLCLMVFLVPVEQLWALGGGWVAVTKVVGVVTFVSFVSRSHLRQRLFRFDAQSRYILAFAAWIALSFLWAKQKHAAPFMAMTVAQLALFWMLLSSMVKSPEDLRAVSIYFIGGTIVAVLVSAFFPRWGLAPRLVYSTGNPNHLARDIVVSLILLIYLLPRARSWEKLAGMVSGGVLLLGLVLTQSRHAWLTAAVCLPLVLIGHKRVLPAMVIAGMALLATVLFSMQVLSAHLGVTTGELEARGESIFQVTTMRASRLDIWRAGIILGSRHPLLGVGAGGFAENMWEGVAAMPEYLARENIGAHNTYVTVFAELGVVGLVLLIVILWRCGRFIVGHPPSLEKMLAYALFAFVLIRMLFGTVHLQKSTWIGLALSQIVLRKEFKRQDDLQGTPESGDLPDD